MEEELIKTRYCPHCDEQKVVIDTKDPDGEKCEKCMYCYRLIYRDKVKEDDTL